MTLISSIWTVVRGGAVRWCCGDVGGRGEEVLVLLPWRRSSQGGGFRFAAMDYEGEEGGWAKRI